MAVRRSPVTWGLVLLVIALVGLGTAVAVWWPLSGVGESTRVTATVVRTASCGKKELDQVEVTVDGKTRTVPLDGCGHGERETLDVLLPSDTSGDFTVQTAGAVSEVVPLSQRLETLMLCLSGMAGGFYVYLISKPVPRLISAV